MSNIDTYVQNNATDRLETRPLCPVDELILCYLVYYDFSDIVPTTKEGGSIALAEAAARYKEKRGDSQKNVNREFLQHIAASARFADARLSGYEELFRKERAQFAAIRITFSEGTEYITFRGVDNTYTGWQEAFRASYSPSPAQRLAAAYLNRHLREEGGPVILGGHSKGGNMALYAGCACEEAARGRIERITLFDSPGLAPGLFSEARYREVAGRVVRLVPRYSLIGRLFTEEKPDVVVASAVEGLLQHEPLYWRVEGCAFAEEAETDRKSERDAQILNRWIARTTPEERKSFTEDLFRMLRKRRDEMTARGEAEETAAPRQAAKEPSRWEWFRFLLKGYGGASRPTRRAARKFLKEIIASRFRGNG